MGKYEISVSNSGKHLFSVTPESVGDLFKLRTVLFVLLKKFPPRENYVVEVFNWSVIGHRLAICDLLEDEVEMATEGSLV